VTSLHPTVTKKSEFVHSVVNGVCPQQLRRLISYQTLFPTVFTFLNSLAYAKFMIE